MVIPFRVISNEMVPFLIIILLTLAQNGLMVSKQLTPSQPNLISSSQLTPFEMDVPSHLEALGSRLTVRIRVSFNSFLNGSEFQRIGINSGELYLQLGIYEGNGETTSILTQQKILTISTNWQEVAFDCGWIVKGGKYFVHLIYSQIKSSSSTSPPTTDSSPNTKNAGKSEIEFLTTTVPSPLSNHNNVIERNDSSNFFEDILHSTSHRNGGDGNMERVLVTKIITVKYPPILFEVPTRLETYTTAAPVTFGLTRTICKPKLKLPSTVLTLTMCSLAASDSSNGPSANHFSFHHNNHHHHNHHFPKNNNNNNDKFGDEVQRTDDTKLSGSRNAAFSNHVSRDRHHHRYNSADNYLSPTPMGKWNKQQQQHQYNHSLEDEIYINGAGLDLSGNALECHRDVTSIYKDPLMALQVEGRVTINVECQLWGRNATYVIQLRETNSKSVIAQSSFIKVEWSSQFSLKLSKSSVLRCQGSIRALVSHPQCILSGRDKVRVYGYETLPVPSLLAPRRVSYIGEQQIKNNNRILSFRCDLFPSRFLRFCFHYVNTAVDESVAVVVERCIPTGPANKISDGGWSSWSKWSSCSVTCGTGGKRFRYRFCDSPPPTTGANFCQGKAIQEEPCDSGVPCPPLPGRRHINQIGTSKGEATAAATISPTGAEDGSDHFGRKGAARRSGRPNFMDFSVLNVSTTPGCECGCILYDLIPTKNYSLVILIAANQSSCADEDEENHHNFRWILHAKDEKDRIRLDVVGMDMQCVTMTFRDGNTTDSNLLEVITASQPFDPIQFEGLYEKEIGQKSYGEGSSSRSNGGGSPSYLQYQYEEDEELGPDESGEESSGSSSDERGDRNLYDEESTHADQDTAQEDTKDSSVVSILRIESTGPSLSIGTTTDSSKNCSGQFIYFIAYYTTIPVMVTGVAERKEEKVGYDFWSFLIVKILVLFFISVVACSTFGGCFTKMYAKYRYKELKCFENEEDECSLNEDEASGGGGVQRKIGKNTVDDSSSRCTSITLMSFDYGYWRRLRILRLKYFLLRSRPLDPVTTKTKSFPNTPITSTKMKEIPSTSTADPVTNNRKKEKHEGEGSTYHESSETSKNRLSLNRPISFSESNLGEKAAILAITKHGYEVRKTWTRNGNGGDEESSRNENISRGQDPTMSSLHPKKNGAILDDHGSVSDVNGGDVSMTSTSVSISISQSLNGSVSSTNSFTTPTPTPTPSLQHDRNGKENNGRFVKGELRGSGIKLLKEQENLKRKASERIDKGERGRTPDTNNEDSMASSENSHRGILKKRPLRLKDGGGKGRAKRILKHGDSTASVSTVQSTGRSTTGDDDSSRVASRADLEDTDQDFEMDYYDYDVMNAGNIPGSYLAMEPAFVLWNSDVYPHDSDEEEHDEDDQENSSHLEAESCLGSEDAKGCMDDSAYGIEMTPSTSSIGMFSQDTSPRKELGMKETSLDTLKFADEDDDEEDVLGSFEESLESIPLKCQSSHSQLKYKVSESSGKS